MKNDEVSRRKFLANTMSITAAVPFLALVGASACKSEGAAPADKPADTPAEPPAASGPICDMAQVPEPEKAKRTALGYVEKSTMPEKNCANCNLFQADNGAGCGGCTLFAGPVSPEGYCNSWVAKPA